jgi:hypothetical protein
MVTRRARGPAAAAGVPVDAAGGPTVDPTKNVLDLVEAAVRRLDDMAAARDSLFQSQVRRLDDLLDERDRLNEARVKRVDDLQMVEARHTHEMADLRQRFEAELRGKETERIDAIRAVDVGAVARASEVAATQATTLATQVQASAEALRNQVQASASASTIALAAALEPIQKSIEELRRTQYEQQGQKAAQTEQRVVNTDSRSANQWMVGVAIGAIVAIVQVVLHFVPVTAAVVR